MAEISKLIEKRVIVKCKAEFGDYISGVFTRDKKTPYNTIWQIQNLKTLIQSVYYKHFKKESIHDVVNMTEPGVSMLSI